MNGSPPPARLSGKGTMKKQIDRGKMRTVPTTRGMRRFEYFAACNDARRLPEIPPVAGGYSASECFHAHETHGVMLPCKEPVMLARALNGKEWHGVTVTNCAQDYLNRLLFANEIKANYPDWVGRDILGRAAQLALEQIGFVPRFVHTGEDFTTKTL